MSDETRARNRFWVLNAIRLGGVLLVMLGIAIRMEKIAYPQVAAYFFVVMGLVEFFFIPRLLKAHWRTRDE
jgi:hypothetical protein